MPEKMAFPYGRDKFGRPTWMGIICRDLEKMRKFYEDVLKMRPHSALEDWANYSLGGVYNLELIRCDNSLDYPEPGIHIGFEHPDLDALKEYLDSQGVKTTPMRGDDQGHWFKAWDPEGNIINFTTHVPRKTR